MSSFAKPVASFADTLREQDEIFYAAFPQALPDGCAHIADSFGFASIQDDDDLQFQQSCSCESRLARAPQLFPSSSQSWFGGHCNPHHTSDSSTFPTHSALYNNAEYSLDFSNTPLTPYTTITPGACQHSGIQGKPSVSGFLAGITTGPKQDFSKGEQLQCDKRSSRSKSNKHNADRKPILACLFCRGRKIACGPPVTGAEEKTCRQCQRRSLTCVYPPGSRRGMRKKKDGFSS